MFCHAFCLSSHNHEASKRRIFKCGRKCPPGHSRVQKCRIFLQMRVWMLCMPCTYLGVVHWYHKDKHLVCKDMSFALDAKTIAMLLFFFCAQLTHATYATTMHIITLGRFPTPCAHLNPSVSRSDDCARPSSQPALL